MPLDGSVLPLRAFDIVGRDEVGVKGLDVVTGEEGPLTGGCWASAIEVSW